ncbi:MAG: hypothetical protein F6K30_22825 [Cyanothece sp. SIO2G6]|nr:hypothetical protein [Cyanothece sp. SIO2G6]
MNEYCIALIGQQEKIERERQNHEKAQVGFEVEGIQYRIIEESDDPEGGYDRIFLVQETGTPKVIQTIQAPQRVGNFLELALSPDGWLWLGGHSIGYTAYVSTDDDLPRIENLTQLPELYGSQCSILRQWWDGCRYSLVGGYYSKSLNRVLMKGYPASFFGLAKIQALEIVSGEVRRLPRALQDDYYIEKDVSTIDPKGVIFQSSEGNLFYYDGETAHQLPLGFSGNWVVRTTDSGRIFLTPSSALATPPMPPILNELKDNLEISPIRVPNEISKEYLRLFQLTDDFPLLGITGNSLYIEDRGALKRIAIAREGNFINGRLSIEQSRQHQSILFTIQNEQNDLLTSYSLRQDATCEGEFDYDSLILLD